MTFIPGGTPPTNEDTGAVQYVDHFNSAEIHLVSGVFEASFSGVALDTAKWVQTVANGGTVTVADGVAKLDAGTDAAGSSKLKTIDIGAFQEGRVAVFQTGILAGLALVDNTKRWGMESADSQNCLYFEMSGTAFGVVARHNGIDTRVEQASFSGLKTFTPDEIQAAAFYIHFSAGQANFEVQIGNKTTVLHSMLSVNLPLVAEFDMHGFFELFNTGNTTSAEMRVRGASQSIDGQQSFVRPGTVPRDVNPTTLLSPVAAVGVGEDPEGVFRPALSNGADEGNSSVALLGAGAAFTGAFRDMQGYSAVSISTRADQLSAVNGIFAQFADDALGTNLRTARVETYSADSVNKLAYYTWHGTLGKFMRIVWTNGATPQTDFFLSSFLHVQATELPQSPVTSSLGGGTPSITTRSILAGRLDDGSNNYNNAHHYCGYVNFVCKMYSHI